MGIMPQSRLSAARPAIWRPGARFGSLRYHGANSGEFPMNTRVVILLAGAACLLAGCSNPFMTNYKGTKFPRTSTATRVMETPDAAKAHLIGTSSFSSTVAPGDGDAISAAEQVGADMVQWDRSFQGTQTALELEPIYGPYTSGAAWAEGGSLIDVEHRVEERWYRYHARFYRDASNE
ncbi:MAG: hypothetical protein CMJ29_10910 [Phycisphaerae bacterium]|nr:hypothetical protein [Phycisphaerae bacterium]|tara:strand:+ start:1184 stop:1717 length:534 start_codon:yes stop_codon:yes gene_type:complete